MLLKIKHMTPTEKNFTMKAYENNWRNNVVNYNFELPIKIFIRKQEKLTKII